MGYILISILIGCMAYNSLYEWQEIEALELGNKKIDELRKEINNINIQMIKFSLLGETILEWNDKDIEHYHARRMAMDSMLCRFKDYKEIYIETERIIIRNFKQKDAEGLLEYLSHPRVNCFAGDRLCSREAAWAYMQYSPKDMLRYAVSLKKDDFIIGDVFALRENEDTYNVGWHFNKRFEGKGFACEAAAGLLDYLFREAGARRIYGFVEDDNIRSKRLCERLGMRREGCFKEFVTFVNNPDGSPKYEDTCVYAILEKEWNTIRQW
ncbi:Protein N-acetyltransferase, RimJ/RimL family [Bacteroides thetaiotaomicron]|nr:Protein N-acetyltransferase, RimJ/RimL family [Bacteroides thetaiotaomicron]